MSIVGGDAELRSSAPVTPTNRIKFLCSHGGKILPRPVDGLLKYVGGETRVICVLRDISFTDLMKKITSMFAGEMILKYQLIPDDFDVLVTVKSDEDLSHMVDECDRQEYLRGPRLRSFLFPANQVVTVNHLGPTDHQSLEHRYINSINGLIFQPWPPQPVNTSYTTFSISSACSSPKTPPETTSTAIGTSNINPEYNGKPGSLTRNRSSPSLCSLGCNQISPKLNQNYYFQPNIHHPQPQPHQSVKVKPPLDRQSGKTRPAYVADYYRHQMDHSPSQNHHRTNRSGQVYYQRGSSYDDYYRYDRNDSPPSPDVLGSSPVIRLGR